MVIFDKNTNQKAHLVSTMKRMKAVLKKSLRIFILTIIGLTSTLALGQSVTISSISPTSSIPGDTITITGTVLQPLLTVILTCLQRRQI